MHHVIPDEKPLKAILRQVWAELYVTGRASAGEAIYNARKAKKNSKSVNTGAIANVDWANWEPGNAAAAALMRPPGGLEGLLSNANATISGLDSTGYDRLGTALANGLAIGASPSRLASMVQDVVASPQRALTIAVTEGSRAMNIGAIDNYRENQIEQAEWFASDPCDECDMNDGEIVDVGSEFPSGDTEPPVHPNCRCTLLPVIPDFSSDVTDTEGSIDLAPNEAATGFGAEDVVEPVELTPAESLAALEAQRFSPGKWTPLSPAQIKEKLISAYTASGRYTRQEAEGFINRNAIPKSDIALLKGSIHKNGPIEVHFSSTGDKVSKAGKQAFIAGVEKLQIFNPKEGMTVSVGSNSSSKYGWATLGGKNISVTPSTITNPLKGISEADSGYKMPALAGSTKWEYTLAHEWGHSIDEGGGFTKTQSVQNVETTAKINNIKSRFPDSFTSQYSGQNSKEFYAEMFAEYYISKGATDNALVQEMAKEFKWSA